MKGTKGLENAEDVGSPVQSKELEWFDSFYLDTREEYIAWAQKRSSLDVETLLDIYQQGMIIVFEKYTSGETQLLDSSLKTYLFGICQNLILKNHRKQDIQQRHMSRLKEHWLFDRTDSGVLEERLEAIVGALQQLQEPCKSIISLFYLRGMSLSDIARKLAYKTTDVVKTQKSRCISTLKETLNGNL